MYDRELVLEILGQIYQATQTIELPGRSQLLNFGELLLVLQVYG